jgi:hypothetical protein
LHIDKSGVIILPLVGQHFPEIKTLRNCLKVPLADPRGLVVVGLQDSRKQLLLYIERIILSPLIWLYLPVSSVARLGAQRELVTNTFLNKAPSLAIRSMFGVFISVLP